MTQSNNGSRLTVPASSEVRKPRICMPTFRNLNRSAYRCSLYEAQDLLVQIDDVDLIYVEPSRCFRFMETWQRRLIYRDVSKRLAYVNPGLKPVTLTREYDLFIAVCQNYWDLLYINAITNWESHCKTSVCWFDELWVVDLPRAKYWLGALKRFDHIFIGCSGTTGPLSDAISQTCRWLPGAVDAVLFSPYPNPPRRAVDVYSIGRRWDGIHRELVREAAHGDMFYMYDTFVEMAEMKVHDFQQHRSMLANLAKRSRYFLVAPAKMDCPEETQGQVELSYRYFEGAAAGAVMIGQAPSCEAFREMFPWPDVVTPIQTDGSDIIPTLAALDSDRATVAAIGRRNAAEALLRHDWVYRWREILRVAGIEPSPRLLARERYLKDLADLAFDAAKT